MFDQIVNNLAHVIALHFNHKERICFLLISSSPTCPIANRDVCRISSRVDGRAIASVCASAAIANRARHCDRASAAPSSRDRSSRRAPAAD